MAYIAILIKVLQMIINDLIWLPNVVDKLSWKHGVRTSEVEEIFAGSFKVRKAEKGIRKNEDVYYAYGQTDSGRYLTVIFVYKINKNALILSAREMTQKERIAYVRK